MGVAYAHSLYAPTPEGFFQLKWVWDPTLLFFLLLCVLYIRGLRAFRGRSPVRLWQKVLFFTGMGVLFVALLPPIDPLSDQLFFVHMVQHLLIVSIGVPLIIFGVPFFVYVRGMPPGVRRYIYFPIVKNRVVRRTFKIIQH